jgi:type II secretory pathway component PulC
MINKIKDFLKNKLSKKTSEDLSGREEILDHFKAEDEDKTNPGFQVEVKRSEVDASDATGEIYLPPEDLENASKAPLSGKPTIKDKLNNSLAFLIGKIKGLKGISFQNLLSKSDGSPLLSPSLSRSIEKFLSRSSREPIHQAALVVLVCAVTYTLGKTTAIILKGSPHLDSSKDYTVSIPLDDSFNTATLTQVKSINIFRTNTGFGPKKGLADKKCEEAQQSSNLPIKLVNTIVLQDSIKSIASVQVRGDRDLQEVRIGDQISNIAQIAKITRLEILVKNLETGMCESIISDTKSKEASSPISVMSPSQSREYKANKKISGIDNVGNKFTISKTLLDDKLKDIAAVLTQAKAIQIQNPDGSLAFKMTELDPTGIFPYLGIQDGDIITSINGKPIYNMNEVMLLFGRIKGLDNLALGIKRDGTDSNQEYSIKK